MTYIVINTSCDGIYVDEMDKETLLGRIEECYWGDKNILEEMPKESDPNYWGDSILILRGELVVPKPVETVTKYEI